MLGESSKVSRATLNLSRTYFQTIGYGNGHTVEIRSKESVHFLFVTDEQLKEPVVWEWPIVINTQAELAKTFEELARVLSLKLLSQQTLKSVQRLK